MRAVTAGWRRPARPAARMSAMPVTPTSLADHLLVALPSLLDATFARSVALICQHDENGAMGVLVNQPSEYTLGEVLAQMDIATGDGELRRAWCSTAARCIPNVASSSMTMQGRGTPA